MKPAHLTPILFAVVLFLCHPAFAHGETASAIPLSSPGQENTAIAGCVTDALTGEPLAGIAVHAGYWVDHWRGGYWEWINATTDEQGQYVINDLWEGTWPVYFSDPQARYLTTWHADVPVSAGQTVAGIDAQLELAGHIAGRVTDAVDQAPVALISVDIYRAGDDGYLKRVYTDANGDYLVGDLTTDQYHLYFSPTFHLPEYYDDAQQIAEATPITVTQGMTTTIDVQLVPQGGITGRATDALGNPLPGIQVWATCPLGDAPLCDRESITDADGRYVLRFLNKDRRFYVVFSDPTGHFASVLYGGTPFWEQATLVPVQPGLLTSGIDAALPVGGDIRGRLTDAATNGPLAGSVALSAWDGSQWLARDTAYTVGDGSYQFKTLHPGRYRIRFSGNDMSYAAEYYPGVPDAADAAAVEIAPGQLVTGIDGALYAARITGRVTAEATGAPLGGIWVYLAGRYCGYVTWEDRTTRTAADGTYGFPRVWPGDCTVQFEDPEWDYEPEWYGDTPDRNEATEFTVIPGALITGIDAALTLRGRITGRVTATTGEPLAGVRVWPIYASYAGPVREAFTDADGRYLVRGLGAGAYRLLFRDPAQQYALRYYGPATVQSAATWVTVTLASVVAGIDVQLPPGGRVAGQVTDRWNLEPLDNADLYLYRQPFENSDVDFYRANSGPQGRYELTGLTSGAYQLCVYAPAYQRACFMPAVVEGEVLVQDVALLPDGTPPSFHLWLPLVSWGGSGATP